VFGDLQQLQELVVGGRDGGKQLAHGPDETTRLAHPVRYRRLDDTAG